MSQVSRVNSHRVPARGDPRRPVAARTFAARPLLAVLFWSTIRFLVVGRRGRWAQVERAAHASPPRCVGRRARLVRSHSVRYGNGKSERDRCAAALCTCICECADAAGCGSSSSR
ncbi:hypothetical protein O0L34_g1525 [Tuta absoluta]|nr:hypothetical protein O0L34_g1525 [Tuta absoluta]